MKKIFLTVLICITVSCKVTKVNTDYNSIKRISLKKIKKKGAIIRPNNNNHSFSNVFLYHFLNTDNQFNKLNGDYYSLKHPDNFEVNIIVNYSKKFMGIENSIIAQIWVNAKNETDLKNLKVKVSSKKNGILNFHSNFNRTRKEQFWVEKLFVKKINDNSLNLLSEDKIDIEINGHHYTFITAQIN